LAMILLTLSQCVGNQFGFDRGGFRALVLSGAPHRDILMGKNLAAAPLALALAALVLVVLQVLAPLRLDHALAFVPQGVPICLLLSLGECAGAVPLYRWVLGWEGRWLLAREQRILEAVAARAE